MPWSQSSLPIRCWLSFDFERVRHQTREEYQQLHGGLTDAHLTAWLEPDAGRYRLLRGLTDRPGLADWLRFKAMLVEELLAGLREVLTGAGGKEKELMPNAFPPPFSLASGFDFGRAARYCTAVSVKLYTMNWAMMLRFYGDALRKANPKLSEPLLVQALVRWFDMADVEGLPRLADYGYPEPNVPHPAGIKAQAQADTGAMPVYALAHGYGPVEDFRKRLQVAWQVRRGSLWINRYGYLSDAKMKVIAEVCRA
jgi:hypothetical protein